MTATNVKVFRLRYKTYECAKCGGHIGLREYAYRVGSRVYCSKCDPRSGGDSAAGQEPPTSKPRRRRRRKTPPPDPTAGGGAMPGEHCANRSADGVWRYEFGSVSEAVADALDDYAQNDSTREYLRGRLKRALSGRDGWANRFTRARLLRELSEPSQHLLDAVDRMRERLVGEVSMPAVARRGAFVVHPDTTESDLKRLSEEDLTKHLTPSTVRFWSAADEMRRVVAPLRTGVPLRHWFILITVILVIFETVISNWITPKSQARKQPTLIAAEEGAST